MINKLKKSIKFIKGLSIYLLIMSLGCFYLDLNYIGVLSLMNFGFVLMCLEILKDKKQQARKKIDI